MNKVTFKKAELQRLFLAAFAPTVPWALTIFLNLQGAQFLAASNEQVTGGIGANQVSTTLSLGSMAAFFYIFLANKDARVRRLMIALSIGLFIASVMTFSRGGVWNTVGSILVAVFFLSRDRRRTSRIYGGLLALAALGYFVIFPYLNNFTNGALLGRFKSIDDTGRSILVEIDYQVFLDHPILGVGVGQSPIYHLPVFGYLKPTHTEYSRLPAEHGILGVIIIAILLLVALLRIFSKRPPASKAISTSMSIWALLYFLHSATRTVAPSLTFGLAAAQFDPDVEESAEGDSTARSNHRRR